MFAKTHQEHNAFSCRRQQSKPEKSWLAQQWAGVDTKCVFQTKLYTSSFSLCVILCVSISKKPGSSSPCWPTPHQHCWRRCLIGSSHWELYLNNHHYKYHAQILRLWFTDASGWPECSPAGSSWKSIQWWFVNPIDQCQQFSPSSSPAPSKMHFLFVYFMSLTSVPHQRKIEEDSSGDLESGTFGSGGGGPGSSQEASSQNHYWVEQYSLASLEKWIMNPIVKNWM